MTALLLNYWPTRLNSRSNSRLSPSNGPTWSNSMSSSTQNIMSFIWLIMQDLHDAKHFAGTRLFACTRQILRHHTKCWPTSSSPRPSLTHHQCNVVIIVGCCVFAGPPASCPGMSTWWTRVSTWCEFEFCAVTWGSTRSCGHMCVCVRVRVCVCGLPEATV